MLEVEEISEGKSIEVATRYSPSGEFCLIIFIIVKLSDVASYYFKLSNTRSNFFWYLHTNRKTYTVHPEIAWGYLF